MNNGDQDNKIRETQNTVFGKKGINLNIA